MNFTAYLRRLAEVRNFFRFFPKREPTLRALQEDIQRKSLLLQRHLLDSTRSLLEVDQNTDNIWADGLQGDGPLNDDPEFFNPMFSGQNVPPTLDKTLRGEILPVYVNWYGLKSIRDYSRKQAQYNPYAMCAIENRCSYICGRGFGYKVVPKDGKDTPEVFYLCSLAQKVIDQFHSSQRWSEKEHECVARCDRDGEAFQRFFHVGNGLTQVRFIEPEWVRGPTEVEEESYGIINTQGDVEDVVGYWIIERPPYVQAKEVPAEEIIHYKANSDSTSKRGLPTLFPVRANLDRAEKLLRNMSVLAQVQSTFAVIRKHKQYSQQAVQGFQQGQADITFPGPTGSNQFAQRMSPGSIIDEPENTELTFPSHGIDAGALVHVLQAELRAVAARLVMPEYMLTANAEGSNFASIAISESPSVKNFERQQSYYARRFGSGAYAHPRNCGAMWRVLKNAVEYGTLPREVLSMCELQVEGPSLIARNKDAETRRFSGLNEKGILSKATWSKYESLDRDNERKQWEKEQNQDLEVQARLEEKQAIAQAATQMKVQMMQQQMQQQMMAAQGISPEQQQQMQQQGGEQGQQGQQGAQQQQGQQPQQQGQPQQQITQQQAPKSNGQELGNAPALKDEQAGVYSELHDLVGGKEFYESLKELDIGSRIRGPSGILYELQEELIDPLDEIYERKLVIIREAKECGPTGECYSYAYRQYKDLADKGQDVALVHGVLTHPHTGKQYGHAWIVHNGSVHDRQTGTTPRAEYMKLWKPKVTATYLSSDLPKVLSTVVKQGHYGPWHEALEAVDASSFSHITGQLKFRHLWEDNTFSTSHDYETGQSIAVKPGDPNNLDTYNVDKLNKMIKGRKPTLTPIKELHGFDRSKKSGFSKKRYETADPSYPILVGPDGVVVDGRHRTLKAMDQGEEHILAHHLTPKDLKAALVTAKIDKKNSREGKTITESTVDSSGTWFGQ